jgi:hypothetical protein
MPGPTLEGCLTNFSAAGTRLILKQGLRSGTMIKVEWSTTVLLGEVIYCNPQGHEFAVGLQLEDALYEKDIFVTGENPEAHDPSIQKP